MSKPQLQKILCAVGGMIHPRAMCGAVIVGLKYCGHTGNCQHQIKPDAQEQKTSIGDSVFSALIDQASKIEHQPKTKADRDAGIAAMKGKASERQIANHFGVSRTLVNTIHKKSERGQS